MSKILTQADFDLINEKHGTNASPEDVEHYKLCQVILDLEEQLGEPDPKKQQREDTDPDGD